MQDQPLMLKRGQRVVIADRSSRFFGLTGRITVVQKSPAKYWISLESRAMPPEVRARPWQVQAI
jgi:hypothetical protein